MGWFLDDNELRHERVNTNFPKLSLQYAYSFIGNNI